MIPHVGVPDHIPELVPVVRLLPPDLPRDVPRLLMFLNDEVALREELREVLRAALDEVAATTPHLKRHREHSDVSWYWKHPRGEDRGRLEKRFTAPDLVRPDDHAMAYGAFDLVLKTPKGTVVEALHFNEEAESFVRVSAPWKIDLHFAETRPLKTQFTFRLRYFLHLELPLITENDLPAPEGCEHQFRCIGQVIHGLVPIWECFLCGVLCICSCFQEVCRKQRLRFPATVPYPVRRTIDTAEFMDNACHICRGVTSDYQFLAPMYARSDFERFNQPYINKKMSELRISEREASNILREELGFRRIGERHVGETRLFHLVQELLPDEEVEFHARPDWLGGLELDVYVPRLSLALEHQGQQHYQPVEAWGGEEAHESLRERDARKAELCRRRGVHLIEVRFDEDLTRDLIGSRIDAALRGVSIEADGRGRDPR